MDHDALDAEIDRLRMENHRLKKALACILAIESNGLLDEAKLIARTTLVAIDNSSFRSKVLCTQNTSEMA